MSVLSALASVGTEIMNTRVEIPAMVTPRTELARIKRRSAALLSAVSAGFTNRRLQNAELPSLNHTAAAFTTQNESREILNFQFSIIHYPLCDIDFRRFVKYREKNLPEAARR